MIHPEHNLSGLESEKEIKPKEPTGILKDLMKLNRYFLFKGIQLKEEDNVVLWSDVQEIINKYSNP